MSWQTSGKRRYSVSDLSIRKFDLHDTAVDEAAVLMQRIILKKERCDVTLWNEKKTRSGSRGWLALFVLCIMFSGILKNVDGPLKALDFSNLVGSWGAIGESGQNFIGKGGTGAREGMMQALSLIPAIAFAVAIIDVVTQLGAIDAGVKIFAPDVEETI